MATTIKKFTLKFNLTTERSSAACNEVGFFAELLGSTEGYETHAKERLINSFIREQEFKMQTKNIWSYEMKAKNDTVVIHATPKINFLPLEGDLETMQRALTQAKISASFFDNQISKHLDSVGIKATRANIRVYRNSYISQISKLLIEEILNKPSTAYVTRWFDRINGNSHFSVRLNSGSFSLNVPMAYGHGNAENLVVRALRLEWPRTMRAREVLERNGVTVVDLGYRAKGELYKAAFRI